MFEVKKLLPKSDPKYEIVEYFYNKKLRLVVMTIRMLLFIYHRRTTGQTLKDFLKILKRFQS